MPVDDHPAPILVLRLSALGDIIHTLPAAAMLRGSFPESRIGWVVEKRFEDLVRTVAPVDRVFVVDTRAWARAPLARVTRLESATAIEEMRVFARGGISIDFQGLIKSGFFAWRSGARTRYGFDSKSIREKAALLFSNRRAGIDPEGHVVDWNRQLAVAAGADPSASVVIDWSRFAVDTDGRFRQCVESRPIVLLPGAGSPVKIWDVRHWVALARDLRATTGIPIVVAWGPGEERAAARIAEESEVEQAPPTTLREIAFLLSTARLVVGGDTGPLHLAAALGTPVVGLYGPTRVSRNGPYGQLDRCISGVSRSGMLEIPVDSVVGMAGRVLAEVGRRRP